MTQRKSDAKTGQQPVFWENFAMGWAARTTVCTSIVLAGMLVAGFDSDTPLFTDNDAVLPLPDQFEIAESDGAGNIKIGDQRPPIVLQFSRIGNHYVTAGQLWTFGRFNDSPDSFVLQIESPPPSALPISTRPIHYVLANLFSSSSLDFLTLPQPGQIPRPAGAECRDEPLAFFFKTRAELIAAVRGLGPERAQKGLAFRVASSPADLAFLQRDLSTAHPPLIPTLPYASQTGGPKPTLCDGGNINGIDRYRKAAAAGNTEAMVNLGERLAEGAGVEKDEPQAVAWFRKAAEAGNTKAMVNLGLMLHSGTSVGRDAAAALALFRKAADAGDPQAMTNLALCLENGDGVSKDSAEAVAWFHRAADAGDTLAMTELGAAFEHGERVTKDRAQSIVWYQKAAQAGNTDGMTDLAMALLADTGQQASRDRARLWLDMAVARGNRRAQDVLNRLSRDSAAAYASQQLTPAQIVGLGIGGLILLDTLTPRSSQSDNNNQRFMDQQQRQFENYMGHYTNCATRSAYLQSYFGC